MGGAKREHSVTERWCLGYVRHTSKSALQAACTSMAVLFMQRAW